jgi:membrane-associated phospholipid phosphatase
MRWLATILFLSATPRSVVAQSPFRVDVPADMAVVAAGFAGGALLTLIPVDEESRWKSEPFAFDEPIKEIFSSQAAAVSDATLGAVVVVPLAAQVGHSWDNATGEATLLFAETLGLSVLLNSAAKHLVQRPRPYVYNSHPMVQRWAKHQGSGSRLSFYSGHASAAFAAAVAGSTLFAARSTHRGARALMWGIELALAASTAGLRVRAGAHFLSDVVVGSAIGIALGAAVPYVHLEDAGAYTPAGVEWAAMAGGIAAGVAVAALAPFANDLVWPLDEAWSSLSLSPWANERGAGIVLLGTL